MVYTKATRRVGRCTINRESRFGVMHPPARRVVHLQRAAHTRPSSIASISVCCFAAPVLALSLPVCLRTSSWLRDPPTLTYSHFASHPRCSAHVHDHPRLPRSIQRCAHLPPLLYAHRQARPHHLSNNQLVVGSILVRIKAELPQLLLQTEHQRVGVGRASNMCLFDAALCAADRHEAAAEPRTSRKSTTMRSRKSLK